MKYYDPIERFPRGGFAYGEMVESENGDYVKRTDAEAILASIAAIRNTIVHKRNELEGEGMVFGSDVIDAILGIIDDNTPDCLNKEP